MWFSKSAQEASNSIVHNIGLIGQIDMPKSLFPYVAIHEALYKQWVVFLVLFAFVVANGHSPEINWLWLIPVMIVQYGLITLCSLIGALSVCYFRDMRMLISMGMMSFLKSRVKKVAFFKPIISQTFEKDDDIDFFLKYFKLDQTQHSAFGIMLGLFEIKVDRVADLLEQLHIELEKLNTRVFRTGESEFEDMLMLLATIQDRNDKTRLSLMDKQRALSFLLRSRTCPEEYLPLLREILQDIRSLDEHSTFLFEKVRFLLDATTGRVNITQNKIIKIFSIAAVVFLPPTLVASIYGMNFRLMPELSWPFGYPLATILMVAAGIAPYWYFKHKDWL